MDMELIWFGETYSNAKKLEEIFKHTKGHEHSRMHLRCFKIKNNKGLSIPHNNNVHYQKELAQK
jgi:hypothetical protein